jgi:hypothetical protein
MNKFITNEMYFQNIDTEKKSYFLGLFAADGCNYINGNRTRCFISLKEEDKDILNVLNYEIFPNNDRKLIYKKSYGSSKPQYKFETFNKQISNDLISYGITPKKSQTLNFRFDRIPENLMNHFIRGYFDGDGCISSYQIKNQTRKKYRISILSTKLFLENIVKYLPPAITHSIKFRDGIYELTISGNNQVKLFCDFIYKNSTTHLNRKHDRYIELVNQIEKRTKKTSSKYRGVSYSKKMKKWLSYFIKNNKQIKVGWFKTEQEAYDARNKFELPKNCQNLEQTKFKSSYIN